VPQKRQVVRLVAVCRCGAAWISGLDVLDVIWMS